MSFKNLKIGETKIFAETFPYQKDYDEMGGKGPKTPWGRADTAYFLAPGVVWYSTPGHGGLGIGAQAAKKLLSAKARFLSESWSGAYWFEEDCGWALAFIEHPEWEHAFQKVAGGTKIHSKEEMKELVQRYYPKYFEALDIKEPPHWKDLKVSDTVWFYSKDPAGAYNVIRTNPVALQRDGKVYRAPTKKFEQIVHKIVRNGTAIFER
jgi:hypothetical protein